jgi:hypothetical protein
MKNSIRTICGGVIAALAFAGTAVAQTSDNRVGAKENWAIFVEEAPSKTCWVVSTPTKVVNSKAGVIRSEIMLFVTYSPSGKRGEVSFTGGYPFKPQSVVKLQIGSSSYDLFAEGEWAWPASSSDDEKIRASMKRGANAILTGESSRGTVTKDTFSLVGFTAAVTDAEQSCT